MVWRAGTEPCSVLGVISLHYPTAANEVVVPRLPKVLHGEFRCSKWFLVLNLGAAQFGTTQGLGLSGLQVRSQQTQLPNQLQDRSGKYWGS